MTIPSPDTGVNKATNYGIYLKQRYSRVLELGPYDGTDSVYLARNTDILVCIEGRTENAATTRKTISDNGIRNALVIEANLESYDLRTLGAFDIVWASGILYHVPDPDMLVRRITQVTRRCLGWTHLTNEPTGRNNGYAGSVFNEAGDPLAGMSPHSWWLTPDEFIRIWQDLHWHCEYTSTPMPHINGGLSAQFSAMSLVE